MVAAAKALDVSESVKVVVELVLGAPAVGVKLTADCPGEEASRMTVLGAACPFAYGPAAGAAGHFESRLWHYSNPPKSKREHLKVAFFFRRRYSTRDMRAARGRGVN